MEMKWIEGKEGNFDNVNCECSPIKSASYDSKAQFIILCTKQTPVYNS